MTKRRIFLALAIPERVKNKIFLWQNDHSDIAARWVLPENLHGIIIPPWYADNDELIASIRVLRKASSHHDPFIIVFDRVVSGPPGRAPRLIWVRAADSLAYGAFRRDCAEALLATPASGFQQYGTPSRAIHATIARLRRVPGVIPPDTDEGVNWQCEVRAANLMETGTTSAGPHATILESIELGDG
ncbi:MAG: hypothetical protein A3I44_01215 [Candidatus Sungbacteria bacterium RIFCSPLOWO2_02_FULL_51_17]|uniref:Uncharacterized protein n=1 Tax=Candidatus Sungbacteria bacterium RIFCSPHIGHO2_02_FULL_51_29 TaxID=1802273 RepID=A0A1G2KSE0_9BACT|nr:MAG: hypothetical protein A2676_00920 [Candidatus Sungbacteria bacterium RIFCSPHIGHO2_01_FULL_51_22]OHA02194.1 MAG: hypothetical protein A3C16_00715 [Candidatus Sungbacteria bacterium RIFCSPHIGHO2_02_FULL_51_29]OHA07647.1 MAG: hypothetical protein A3B29_05620 [Candidatus Sungbacteria bacterium RIFCSPLOWO2_01_FULL_51_34]OHA10740.1 MAG: hypothetical protein A3I44_01215 [Candidatus Sungbacteria bacterium RIFCSPLOWO2_02_FULL_51_17]